MRLIDADKIESTEIFIYDDYVEMAYMDDIRELPTVDAIPVEWINKNKKTGMFVSTLLTMWEYERLAERKEEDLQRDYENSVEMAEYCERYEPTYNPEDGSL